MRKNAARVGLVTVIGATIGFAATTPASADSCVTADGMGVCTDGYTVPVGGQVLPPLTLGGYSVNSPTTVCVVVTCFAKDQPIATVPVETTPPVSTPIVGVQEPSIAWNECIHDAVRWAELNAKQGYYTNVVDNAEYAAGCPIE